jgi:hypothetical protein
MERSKVLIVDSIINLGLGILLMAFPPAVVRMLGVPTTENSFYPTILGAVLCGIGIALLIDYFRRPGGIVGLGLGGAISINLCAGLVLAVWLVRGTLAIPFRGQVFLWTLVITLASISCVELIVYLKKAKPKEAQPLLT